MSIPFIPATPTQAARSIARKMGLIRQGLMAKGEYLSDPMITERVGWEPVGSGHRLVFLPHPSPTVNTREATPHPDGSVPTSPNPFDSSSPSDNAADTSSHPTDNVPTGPLSDDTTPDPPAPAVLSIVVQLVPGQSWLYPDGRWTGPTKFVRRFTDVKLLCTGAAADHPRFANDYGTAVANLNEIMGLVGDTKNDRNSILSGPANQIRVRHPLFTVCPTYLTLKISPSLLTPDLRSMRMPMRLILPVSRLVTRFHNRLLIWHVDVAYTRAWPTSSPEAANALAVAAETHSVNPLPAYDLNGVLVEPQYYTKRLDGATVIIRFELNHYLIRSKDKPSVDTFSARVVQLRVILPPPGASPATPRKKKVLPRDDYFGSFTPTKRGRGDEDDENSDDDKENGRPLKSLR